MAWTTPRTWVAGETVTASQLNTHIKDNLTHLYSSASPVLSLDKDTSVTDVASSIAETDVYSYSVAGGTLGSNGGLRLIMVADFLNDSAAVRTTTLRVKYGSTTIFSYGLSTSASSTRAGHYLYVVLMAANATNAQRSYGVWEAAEGSDNNAGGTGNDTSNMRHLMAVHNAIAEDSTTAKTLKVTIQHDASSSSLSFKCHTVHLESFQHT